MHWPTDLMRACARLSSNVDASSMTDCHVPGSPGERDSEQIAMRQAFGGPVDPEPQGGHRGRGPPLEDDVGGLHKERAEVLVAALGEPTKQGAIAGRLLLRDEAEPGGAVTSLLEAAAGT